MVSVITDLLEIRETLCITLVVILKRDKLECDGSKCKKSTYIVLIKSFVYVGCAHTKNELNKIQYRSDPS